MKAIGWLAIGGVGLYLADQMGLFASLSGTTTTSQVATSPQAANPNAAQTNQTLNMVIAAMQKDGLDPVHQYYSASQYNFYYNIVRGIPGPELPQFPVNELISVSDWWGGLTASGLSGLGMIAHHVNPYLQGPRANTAMFGAGLAPNGMETYIIRRGEA